MAENKKKKSSWLFKVIVTALLLIIAVSGYNIAKILWEYHEGTSAYKEIQQVANAGAEEKKGEIDFDALKKKNKDVKAWLYSEGTPINYPVVQGPDNQYYLYRMFNGEYNGKGSLFIDFRCEKPFRDFNTIIYGHRMKDGSMFHDLIEYRDKSYYEKHKIMQLTTPKKKYDVHVFAVVTIPADSDLYRSSFRSDVEKENYLQQILAKNETEMGVSVSSEDHIVMLSTCTYEYDDARLVVYGKLVEREEE